MCFVFHHLFLRFFLFISVFLHVVFALIDRNLTKSSRLSVKIFLSVFVFRFFRVQASVAAALFSAFNIQNKALSVGKSRHSLITAWFAL